MAQHKILWVRFDAIGDNVLAASMLPHIFAKYDKPQITILCQQHVAELYGPSPFVSEVIGIDKMRLYLDSKLRNDLLLRIQSVGFDVAFDTAYSWDRISNFFVVGSLARERITIKDQVNIPPALRLKLPQAFTRLVDTGDLYVSEMDRYVAFLNGIGIGVDHLNPTIWTTAEDEQYADNLFTQNGLEAEKTIALFAFGRSHLRTYPYYGTALAGVCRENGFSVIGLGDGAAYGFNQVCMDDIGARSLNLSGRTTLRQTAALLKRCRLSIGAETGLAHVACAVSIPNVVVIGGGHFGRFMPYSPTTSLVALPLDCYWCDWLCKYEYSHCIVDVAPEVLEFAVRETLRTQSDKPRLFLHPETNWEPPPSGPAWKMAEKFTSPDRVEVISAGLAEKYPRGGKSRRDLESKFATYNPKELPQAVSDSLKKASELRASGQTIEAYESVKKAAAATPGFPDLLNLKGELEIEMGLLDEARATLFGVIALVPFHTGAMNNIAVVEIMQHRYESAIGVLKRLLEVDPNNEVAASNLRFIENDLAVRSKLVDAEQSIIDNGLNSARGILADVLSINPSHEDALADLAVVEAREGNREEALKILQEVLATNPGNEFVMQLMEKLLFAS